MYSAEHWSCTNEEYHASEGWSNTKLSDFLRDRAMCYAKHVAHTYIEPPKDCYRLGSTVHAQVLLGKLDGSVVEIPDDVLNTQGHRKGKAWTEFAAEHEGKILYKPDELAVVNRYCDALMANKTARIVIETCLADGRTEYSVRWTDDDTELPCRCRFDLFHAALNADLKTCQDNSPAAFAKSILNYGYHRQAVFYGDGSTRLRAGEQVPFWFFAVTPFSCRVYTIDDVFRELGEHEVRKALTGIRQCLDSGEWTDGTEEDPIALSPPGYAFTNQAYEVYQNDGTSEI